MNVSSDSKRDPAAKRSDEVPAWELPVVATLYRTKRRQVIRNGPATHAAGMNDRNDRRCRRDIRGQACRASARDQGRLPDAPTQIAARPAMELRAGECNS